MFYPVNLAPNLFRHYLRINDHPGKIRIQNWVGRNLFRKGILFRNEKGVLLNLNANDWITRIMLLEGNYENGSIHLAMDILQQGTVFVDIGANFGLYSCQVNSVHKNIQTIAVDANYKIIPALVANIQLNNIQNNIRVFNVAISEISGFVVLEQPAADNIGTTQTKQGKTGFINVSCCNLQQLLDANSITKVSLIKIDIEGNEFSVFKNFDFDKYKIDNILLEFNHLSETSLAFLLDFFLIKGFQALKIDGTVITKDTEEIPENNIWFKSNVR